jgi:hypothetical protein
LGGDATWWYASFQLFKALPSAFNTCEAFLFFEAVIPLIVFVFVKAVLTWLLHLPTIKSIRSGGPSLLAK